MRRSVSHRMKLNEHPCSAGFPACGFTELSSSVNHCVQTTRGLESPRNPQTGMSALHRWAIDAAPFPLFRTRAQSRIQWVGRCIITAAIHILVVANKVVKRLRLPKLFTRPLQELIRFARGVALPALQNLAQCPARQWSQHRVNVIRHDHPCLQLISGPLKEF